MRGYRSTVGNWVGDGEMVWRCVITSLVTMASCASDPSTESSAEGTITGIVSYTGLPPGSFEINPDGTLPGVFVDLPYVKHDGAIDTPQARATVAAGEWTPPFVVAAGGRKVTVSSVGEESHDLRWPHIDRAAGSRSVYLKHIFLGSNKSVDGPSSEGGDIWIVDCVTHREEQLYLVCPMSRYWAISDSHGKFRFEGLKPGKYTVAAWGKKLGHKRFICEVFQGKNSAVNISF